MVYGHQIMRGKSPQVAGDEATPRVHIQTSRQSWRLTERKVYFVPCPDSQCGERIPRTLAMPTLVRPPREALGNCIADLWHRQNRGVSVEPCIEPHNRLADLVLFLHAHRDSFASVQHPFHDPGPRKFLQFHATRLWCGAEPDTSPPGAGMRYSRCAVYWSYPRVEHQIVRPPSFESDRW